MKPARAQLAAGRRKLEAGEAEYVAGVAQLQEQLRTVAIALGKTPEALVNGLLTEDPETRAEVETFFADADAALAAAWNALNAAPLPDEGTIDETIAALEARIAELEELVASLPEDARCAPPRRRPCRRPGTGWRPVKADHAQLVQYRQEALDGHPGPAGRAGEERDRAL